MWPLRDPLLVSVHMGPTIVNEGVSSYGLC